MPCVTQPPSSRGSPQTLPRLCLPQCPPPGLAQRGAPALAPRQSHSPAAANCSTLYITLYYITLYYIILHYITLYYIILYYITLYYITLYYITLYYIILHYITLHYIIYCIIYYIILYYKLYIICKNAMCVVLLQQCWGMGQELTTTNCEDCICCCPAPPQEALAFHTQEQGRHGRKHTSILAA
jgi:hypothetical protein